MSTERQAPRVRTLIQGRIEFNSGASSLNCLVRDLSDVGAKLEFSDSVALPAVFLLHVAKYQRCYRARERWHRTGYVGVEFEANRSGIKPESADQESEVARLKAELARLRNLLEEIRADPSKARLLLETAA